MTTRGFSLTPLGLVARTATLAVALGVVLAGCSDAPRTLRIVSGPPQANVQVAALLASKSEEAAAPVRLTPVASVADSEAALSALAAGTADVAIVENSVTYREPTVRTVAPLYPSVLHIGVRPEKRGQAVGEVLNGATVFAGDEQSPGRQMLTRMASMYAWREIEFSFVDVLDDRADVIFMFAPISPSSAPILDGYELLSLGRAEDVGRGSAADALSLVAPFLRPFVIPQGTYGPLTPTAIATVAVDTLLVARAAIPRVVVYDLVESVQMMGPLLVAERPDMAVDELDTFDISHVTFPVHPGAMGFRVRNEPGFAERASGIFEVLITIVAAIGTTLVAVLRYWRNRKKARIDQFYSQALAIRAKLSQASRAQRRVCTAEARALRDSAFECLISEKLSANESFRILQALIQDVIWECESSLASPATTSPDDPSR